MEKFKKTQHVVMSLFFLFSLLVGFSPVEAKMLIYPTKGQTPEQQRKDEMACHRWAVQQTGFDPTQIREIPKTQNPKKGGVIKGGALGALVGVGVGAIAGDAGKGAAIGAVAGGAAGGIRQHRQNQQQAQESQQAQGDLQAKLDAYNRAKALCLEGKGYKVSW